MSFPYIVESNEDFNQLGNRCADVHPNPQAIKNYVLVQRVKTNLIVYVWGLISSTYWSVHEENVNNNKNKKPNSINGSK
jgi:hypothetical protein